MVTETARPDTSEIEIETASIEHAIDAALARMRSAAAEAAVEAAANGRDDFCEVWTAEVMDHQPMVFVAALLPGETRAWLIDPGNEDVLESYVSHDFDLTADGALRSDRQGLGIQPRGLWSRLYASVADDVSWLVRERSGRPLSAHRQWTPQTN